MRDEGRTGRTAGLCWLCVCVFPADLISVVSLQKKNQTFVLSGRSEDDGLSGNISGNTASLGNQ